jgi:exopolyphosphatase / guanosine-5'-triphosphate,3'-diphosphate pyrophosphatase
VTRVAAIDCGTNSLRLLISDIDADGRARDVERCMEIVRLGQGVDKTGRLHPDALERTERALRAYKEMMDRAGVERTRMVATSAIRDARNADRFREMVVGVLGQEPEVVSGDEEARLSFMGAVRGLPAGDYLMVDIGGGSTEFVRGDQADVRAAISVDIGAVRMTERHLHTDPPELSEMDSAAQEIGLAVEHALEAVRGPYTTLVGLAGSVTTVTAIALGLTEYQPDRIHHAQISRQEVAHVTAGLAEMTREQRTHIGAMHPGRVDVIVAGALILRTIMEKTGAQSVLASEHDILDGIASSLA